MLATAVGETYTYDADAVDMNIDDTIAFSIVDGPDGLEIDASTGEVSFVPTIESPPSAMVTIVASDGHGGDTEQSYALDIEGGMGSGDDSSSGGDDDGSASGGPSDDSGDPSGPATSGNATSTDTDDPARGGGEAAGCGCGTAPIASLWFLLLPALRRRRA